ncbi:MAG: VRR-NUC domain-containing protein [Planctomycetota bacterium]
MSRNDTESDLERQVVEYVESKGGEALKLRLDNRRGFPDRTILLPGGVVLFLELKKPGGRLSHHQEQWLERMNRLGLRAMWSDNFERVKEEVDKILYFETRVI